MAVLHNPVAQEFVFSVEQILHKSVAAFVDVAHCTREMMINSRSRGAAEVIRNRENFIRRFFLAK